MRIQDGAGLGNNVTVSRSAFAHAHDKPIRGMVGSLHFSPRLDALSDLPATGEHDQRSKTRRYDAAYMP